MKIIGLTMNVIDCCWRWNPNWQRNRLQLATCSIGYAGKMTNNIGRGGLTQYVMTDPSNNPINSKGSKIWNNHDKREKWITFQRNMQIKLEKPLLICNFTTIDGQGADFHIADNAYLMIYKVHNL